MLVDELKIDQQIVNSFELDNKLKPVISNEFKVSSEKNIYAFYNNTYFKEKMNIKEENLYEIYN